MPNNLISGGTWQNKGDFVEQPHDTRVPTPDQLAQRLGSPSWAEWQAKGVADGKAVYEAAVGTGATTAPDPVEPDPDPVPDPTPTPVQRNRKVRLFWYCSFANVSFLPDHGGVFAPLVARGWNLSLRDGFWPGHSAHHTVDSLLARHPFLFADRTFGVYDKTQEFVVGTGANGEPGMCAVRGPRQAAPAVLTGYVTAWRLRTRKIRERGGESLCYMGPPPWSETYSATAADNWFKEARQAEFDGIGLDVGGVLKAPAPAYVVANRCGNYGMKCWMEPPDSINTATAALHNGRVPFVAMESWALDSERLGRHRPSTMLSECMVILDASSGTGDAMVAKVLAWRDKGYSVAVEPSGLTPAQLDQVVAAFR
jgi:hypothetical protein